MDGLCIVFVLDFLTGGKLRPGKYLELLKQLYRLVSGQGRYGLNRRTNIGKPPLLCLLLPFSGVSVAVKDDAAVLDKQGFD